MEFNPVKELKSLYHDYNEAMEQEDVYHASLIHQTITAIENIFDDAINNKEESSCKI